MTHTQKRGLCWLLAAVLTAAMMVFVLTSTNLLYANNDDAAIMHAIIGYETGEPADFHLFIHGLLLWGLGGLTKCFPGVAWFSIWQLAMIALSCLVIAKSIMQSFLKYRKPLWMGAVLSAVFVLVLCMKHAVDVTFTLTAALLGAAAVAQMLSIEHDRGAKHVVVGMAGALVLVGLSYVLRLSALMPVIGFCGLAWLFLLWEDYGFGKVRPVKPMLVSLALVAVGIGALLGIRQYELTRPEVQDYLTWQESRTQLMDYVDISKLPQEAFDQLGWSDATANMAKNWCFLDSDITVEAFDQLAEYHAQHDTRTLKDYWAQAQKVIDETIKGGAMDLRCLLAAGLVLAAALVCACACRRGKVLLMLAALLASCAGMMVVLAMAGRLPMRAALMILLPACAALFALLPACMPKGIKWPLALTAVVCALYAVWCLTALIPTLLKDENEDLLLGSAMGDLEEYALFEPESLFIYDDTMVGSDLRMFPDYSEGVPDNVTFWGGWTMRSPESVEQFARFDIDLHDFDPYTLLRDDVYIASGRIDPPPMIILNWLQEKIGPQVDYELYSEYGYVYIFHFYEN